MRDEGKEGRGRRGSRTMMGKEEGRREKRRGVGGGGVTAR